MKRRTLIRIAVWSSAAVFVGVMYWIGWGIVADFEKHQQESKVKDGRLRPIAKEELAPRQRRTGTPPEAESAQEK